MLEHDHMVLPTLKGETILFSLLKLEHEVVIKRNGVLYNIRGVIGIAEVKSTLPVYGQIIVADLP